MKKFLFLLFPAFITLSVLNCSGDNDMPCMTCEEPFPLSASQSSHEYGYCLADYGNDIERCIYMSLERCSDFRSQGQYYGNDRTCGGWYDPDADVSSSSRDRSSSSSSRLGSSSSGGGLSSSGGSSSSSSSVTGGNSSSPVGRCPNATVGNGTLTCGGQTYKTVVIGTQTWMAENLNYDVSGSVCYNNNQANCATYGRLYDQATAIAVCPSSWHIPSDDDWDELLTAVGGELTAGTKLKANSDLWKDNGKGTDEFGFSALPGGTGKSDGRFGGVGGGGGWWSADYYSSISIAYDRAYDIGVIWVWSDRDDLLSIRCLKD